MARTSTTRSGTTDQYNPLLPQFPTLPTYQNPAVVGAAPVTVNPGVPQNPLSFIPQVNTGANAGGLPPALLKQTADSLSGALKGELPQDVQDLLRQQAAEYGVASGMPGSQFQSYRGLRNLGLTSLDRIKGAEGILGNQFINPAQAQDLQLRAGATRAGLAQNANEQAQSLALAQAKLGQEQTQFTRGQELEREKLGQQYNISNLQETGANYRAALGLNSGGKSPGGGHAGTGFTGGATTPGGGLDIAGSYGAPVVATGTGAWTPRTYDYGYNNPSVVTGAPYDGGSYDDTGFTNYDDVIDYYGY